MRARVPLFALFVLAWLLNPAVAADGDRAAYKGIWISTPYPSFSVASSESVTLDLTVHNSGLPPQRVALEIKTGPDGWGRAFLGDGKRIDSVFVAPDGTAAVKLRLEPPENAGQGTYRFDVAVQGTESSFALPIDLTIGNVLPPKMTLRPELPVLKGSPSSEFKFKLKVKNEGGSDAVARMEAAAPPAFQVKFMEEFGSQELTSFPLKPGEEKTVSAKVELPQSTKAGAFPVAVQVSTGQASAQARLQVEVTGAPRLTVSGAGERLSADTIAGEATPADVILTNTGTAPARNVKLTASEPSGWKVAFDPPALDLLPPGGTETVKATVTPAARAIAGDYMVKISANGDEVSASSDFRMTVRTSTLWGIVGVLVIAAAMVVLVLAVVRYGRR